MKNLFSSRIVPLVIFSVIVISAYFINVEVQTHFGKQALKRAALISLPFEQALVKAGNEDKLVLVDVSAIWCSTCRKLDNEIFANQEVKRLIKEKFVFSRLEYEAEESQGFIEKYEVSGFPTLLLIDENGSVVKRLAVTFNVNEFLEQLR